MASPIGWRRVWASSGSWWQTGKPGVLQSMGLQRVRYDLSDWTESWRNEEDIHLWFYSAQQTLVGWEGSNYSGRAAQHRRWQLEHIRDYLRTAIFTLLIVGGVSHIDPAVVLSPLAHAHWTTEQRYATCLTHFGTSISHFTVSVSLWGLKRFSYLLYVGARKKVSLYSWNLWKRYCKNRKWLESDRNFCATNIRTLSRINLLFIKIKFMFYRCMSAYNFFAHHIQFLWS